MALVYVDDSGPGFGRRRCGSGFRYTGTDGATLRDPATMVRIRRLAIPPAYTRVWICPLANGHLQATARDARGRKQYRYHADWRRSRDAGKFDRLAAFGAALPAIRRRVAHDLSLPVGRRMARETVLATVVRLLDTTLERVGNDQYARDNHSFGLTTLHNRHAAVDGETLRLRFRGKSGVARDVSLRDRRVTRIVRRCQALPGQTLFQFIDEAGSAQPVDSADVNAYLRAASGGDFTAKDFRTWHGSVAALALSLELSRQSDDAPGPAATKRVLTEVAARLGNTVAVCRTSYVHPRVLALLTGDGAPAVAPAAPKRRRGLSADERALLALLAVRRR